ncbi:MAG: NrfD/PsrC family molybdoenzyme membrane anchor subunit [Gemmatimonadota bacterium]
MIPDSFFSASPRWGWLIALYFFFGGIAGGSLFLSGLMHLAGRPSDRPRVRRGRYIAFAGALVSGVLLTVDLTKPLRFWHMLWQADGSPMFKLWSPMSVGAWGLLVFSAIATLLAASSLAEERRIRWEWPARLGRATAGKLLAAAGAIAGLFLAGYTGVLLAVTNRPVWSDSPWLGALFLLSGVSTGAAALILADRRQVTPASEDWLALFDRRIMIAELLVLVAFVASLGAVARVFAGLWGVALLLGVAGVGIALPIATKSGNEPGRRAALMVLAGGLMLRLIIVFASEGVPSASMAIGEP